MFWKHILWMSRCFIRSYHESNCLSGLTWRIESLFVIHRLYWRVSQFAIPLTYPTNLSIKHLLRELRIWFECSGLFLFLENPMKGKCIHAETIKAGDYTYGAVNLCYYRVSCWDYLSGVYVDLPPKKPFNRARRAMKKRRVKSKSSIVSFVLSWTLNLICKDSNFLRIKQI